MMKILLGILLVGDGGGKNLFIFLGFPSLFVVYVLITTPRMLWEITFVIKCEKVEAPNKQ